MIVPSMRDHAEPDFSAAALVTIDVQVDTLDGGRLEIPGTSAAVPQIGTLASAFRSARLPIVHVVRLYRRDGSNADLCRRGVIESGIEILAPGSRGSQLAPGILRESAPQLDAEALLGGRVQEVGPGELVVYKPRWGAFYGTELEGLLGSHGVSTLVFCGCNFPNCPRTSIYEASERDFRIVLAADAISGLYDRGCEELRNIGVRLMTTAEICDRVPLAATANS
jgi:nicotinamidase-related amidase